MRTTNKSLKNEQLDKILDKIKLGFELNEKEKSFLSKFNSLSDEEFMEYRMLSRFEVTSKITSLINNDLKVICNLCDKQGPLGLEIKEVIQTEDNYYLLLEKAEKIKLKDSILYDLTYNFKRWHYSLESGEEFVELALINKE